MQPLIVNAEGMLVEDVTTLNNIYANIYEYVDLAVTEEDTIATIPYFLPTLIPDYYNEPYHIRSVGFWNDSQTNYP